MLPRASPSGISLGIASRASSVDTCSSVGITRTPSSPSGGGSARRRACRPRGSIADDEAAEDRRGDVVGMALELGRVSQQLHLVERQLVEVVGGDQAGDDRRRARAETARQWDLSAAGRRCRRRSAASRKPARPGCRGRSARRGPPGRRRTLPSPRFPARATDRAQPTSRRSPARGWPRRRGRGRLGAGRSIEHRPLDRGEVVLAVDHGRGFGQRRVGVLEAMAGQDTDNRLRCGRPSATGNPCASRPATDAAEAGSQKTPSLVASQR